MAKIGFKSWGTTISKWENSFFGGFNRLVIDYPSVEIDMNVDFDFAPIKYLSYFEKEKIMKIFLSKAKTYGLIDALLKKTKSVSETNFEGQKIIKTTINKDSQKLVLTSLIRKGKEYSPLFNHYKKFILDSSIFFQRPDHQNDGCESEEDKQENENQENENQENENQDNENDEKDDRNASKHKILTTTRAKNLKEFKKALKNIKEEKIKFDSISKFNKKTHVKIQKSNGEEAIYSHQEKNVADNLTKMLDISFDPTSDIVKNLRLGKLDISKIAEVPAGNIAIYKQTVENQTTKPFSVVILCDESGSMNGERLRSQYHIVKSLYRSFSDILPQDKIFIYGHSGESNPELYVYQDPYNQNFLTTIDNMMERCFAQNYDGPVIEQVYKNVRTTTDDRIIFIVLSDGEPSGYNYGGEQDFEDMRKIIEKCKRDDFLTIGIGIQAHHVKDLYQYSTIVSSLNEMPKKVSHIVNHVVKTEFQ